MRSVWTDRIVRTVNQHTEHRGLWNPPSSGLNYDSCQYCNVFILLEQAGAVTFPGKVNWLQFKCQNIDWIRNFNSFAEHGLLACRNRFLVHVTLWSLFQVSFMRFFPSVLHMCFNVQCCHCSDSVHCSLVEMVLFCRGVVKGMVTLFLEVIALSHPQQSLVTIATVYL